MSKKSKKESENFFDINLIYNEWYLIGINNFRWLNLPEGMESHFFEKPLWEIGACCFTGGTRDFAHIVLPASAEGKFNIYYEPTTYRLQGYDFSEKRTVDNSVFIKNNLLALPSAPMFHRYARRIFDIQQTIDINLFHYRSPVLFGVKNSDIESVKNVLADMVEGKLAVFHDKNFEIDGVKAFNITGDFVIDKLYQYKRRMVSEVMSLLGFSNNEIEKKERMIVDEINANNELTDNGYVLTMFDERKKACDKINEMFGLNISVEINRQKAKPQWMYDDLSGEGGEENV